MRIGVDIDSVVCDLINPLMDRINKKYGVSSCYYDVGEWDWTLKEFTENGQPIQIKGIDEIRAALSDKEFTENLPMIPDALVGVNFLGGFGDVVFVTSRNGYTKEFTRNWVRNNFGTVPVEFSKENKNGHKLDLLIDDNIETVISFVATGKPAILFDRPWNGDESDRKVLRMTAKSADTRYYICSDWEEVLISFAKELNMGRY